MRHANQQHYLKHKQTIGVKCSHIFGLILQPIQQQAKHKCHQQSISELTAYCGECAINR